MVQQISPRQEQVVVPRTRVIQRRQGKRPLCTTSTSDQSITLVILFKCTNCEASQQAERYEAGHDAYNELASHDACLSLLIDHLTGGLINVLVFVALQFDTAHHYSVASSHEQRFGSD
jgi:hypothetical protein